MLRAQAAREKVSGALEGGSGDLAAQAKKITELCTDLEGSMVATGTTLVQIISEPTKPLAILTTLHNIMEHTEGPPNQPWFEVFEKVVRRDGRQDRRVRRGPGEGDGEIRWVEPLALVTRDRISINENEMWGRLD